MLEQELRCLDWLYLQKIGLIEETCSTELAEWNCKCYQEMSNREGGETNRHELVCYKEWRFCYFHSLIIADVLDMRHSGNEEPEIREEIQRVLEDIPNHRYNKMSREEYVKTKEMELGMKEEMAREEGVSLEGWRRQQKKKKEDEWRTRPRKVWDNRTAERKRRELFIKRYADLDLLLSAPCVIHPNQREKLMYRSFRDIVTTKDRDNFIAGIPKKMKNKSCIHS